jgi:tetratricopeptide (TPR) repeat protein
LSLRRSSVKDGRSNPGHSKKRPQRAEPEPGFGPFRGAGVPKRRRAEEARTVRSAAEEAVARASGERPALRIVKGTAGAAKPKDPGRAKSAKRAAPNGSTATPRPKPVRDGSRFEEALIRGARALDRGYENEALRILRPYRELFPDSADLRELLGVTYYRLGKWAAAQKELETYVGLTDSTEQHPVLMDVARALGRYKKVNQLWEELRAASPGAEIMTEGRIVAAGALADQGQLEQAIRVLERAPASPRRLLPHHLRLWYALADLHERAGDIPAARALFRKISAQDPSFVDVAERLAALS